MPPKKLGKLRKFVGRLGRWIYFKTSKKFSLYALTLFYQTLIDYLAEINENDYKEALYILEERITSPEAFSYLYNLMTKKVGGLSFETFISKDLDDLEFITPLFLYAIFGSYYKDIFGQVTKGRDENGIFFIKIPLKKCFMCMMQSDITKEDLGDSNYGGALVVLLKKISEMVQDFAHGENPYRIIVKETKCILKGDPEGETQIWYYEK